MAKMVLFSAVQGRVLKDGQPVAGATLEREAKWTWKDETRRDSTTSGADGGFAFEPMVGSSLLGSVLPHEPVVHQKITIRHGGQAYEAWLHVRHSYEDNGELGRPLKLVCRLEAPPQRRDGYYGICTAE